MRSARRWLAVMAVLAFVAAACGDDGGDGGGAIEPPVVYDEIGELEGQLELIAWHGYTEDGTTEGYEEYDWVTPFEDETGCQVNVTYADTSDEMVTLMRQGEGGVYDGVSASGNASNRLIAAGDVGAVDPALFPDLENVIGPLHPETGTNNAHYVVDGNVYGVPYMYGPNFLMYNTDVVTPAPTSWDVTFEADSPYAGSVTAYDDPIFIADAAMYLMTHNPDLGITDPYELTQEQFDASVELLQQQSELVGSYWALYTDQIDGFLDGSMVVGTAWPVNFTFSKEAPAAAVIPSEGVTGWADTWMISANAPNPNCMLSWMDWTLQPDVQAEVGVYYGAAGSNVESCALIAETLGEGGQELVDSVEYSFCGNEEFLNSIYLWKTPQVDCGDDRGEVCIDYSEWTQAWTEIRGA
ncbi:MAG TPA: extracellular solute-binding protein [Actinomycetota bacterium]|jgi:putative spermidine/putrescine transport system substrate-binding protein